MRYRGILEDKHFVQISSGIVPAKGNVNIPLQAGDIAIIGADIEKGDNRYDGKYHACLYTASRGWVSDFIQNSMNVYKTKQPYAIYRYHNKKKS